ncbi:MAG: protein-glutamate O-methyltransferase CheR [Deltaproteobacteria bacterium]|nr:protein-glutamate O-methyltransferase CheR [Deltaproteobacteria bacterium]
MTAYIHTIPYEDEEGMDGLTNDVFSLFSNLIYKYSGIKLNANKQNLLTSRLAKRINQLGLRGVYDYYQMVRDSEDERIEMLNRISTNTTKFFRENYHFEYLKNSVIPKLLKDKTNDRTIRIWSAGCSTGEEPYSIAISVCEVVKRRGWDIKILATDISTKALETAKAGIYEMEQIPDDLPTEITAAYFMKGIKENEGRIKAKDFLKEMIRFRRLNLKDAEYQFSKKFDVIFCRNVMIYFDENMKRHVMNKFHTHLTDDGCMFLGHSETVLNKEVFTPVYITVYRKKM